MRIFKSLLFLLLLLSVCLFIGCSDDDDNPVNPALPDFYTSGNLSYNWSSIAIPPATGTFSITGFSLTEAGVFPQNITEVCGGSMIPTEAGSVAFCYAGEMLPDTTFDIFFVVVNNTSSAITPGSYSIDPLNSFTTFVYLEGVESFEIPADFDPTDITAWANTLTAENIFLGVTGTITITEISSSNFTGTFTGTMATQQLLTYFVTGGSFSVVQ